MHIEPTLQAVGDASASKAQAAADSTPRYFVRSLLAGAYVGLGVALIFAIGAPLAAEHSAMLKLVMGATFGGALALVIFAGAELFTGNALVLGLGVLSGRSSIGALARVWAVSYLGNLVGSLALAWLLAQSGVFGDDPQRSFIETTATSKMHLAFGTAFVRGILANWLVCVAVWCASRKLSDSAKLILVFWCLFAFVSAGFEHSVANMTLLGLALFQPHGDAVTWLGYVQNLVPVTLGNIVGGAVLVGGAYWASASGADRWWRRPARVVSLTPVVEVEREAA
jgi:nitrite transporter NirC